MLSLNVCLCSGERQFPSSCSSPHGKSVSHLQDLTSLSAAEVKKKGQTDLYATVLGPPSRLSVAAKTHREARLGISMGIKMKLLTVLSGSAERCLHSLRCAPLFHRQLAESRTPTLVNKLTTT